MGRHGAAPSSSRAFRVSIPLLAIGAVVAAAIGVGIWLWSLRSATDPIGANPVDAYAVVISSPACTSGSGSTVVELSLTPVVRSSLSACGRRTGERLAVQYLAGHPDQVRLAGTTVAGGSAPARWLPIAVVAAGLIAVVATIALTIDRRQSRHAGTSARVTVDQLRAAAGAPAVHPVGAGGTVAPGAAAGPAAGPAESVAGGGVVDQGGDANPEITTRIPTAGFSESNPFRPSEILVADQLFTHRGPETPDR